MVASCCKTNLNKWLHLCLWGVWGGVLQGDETEMSECYQWSLLAVLLLDMEPMRVDQQDGGCFQLSEHKPWNDWQTAALAAWTMIKGSVTGFLEAAQRSLHVQSHAPSQVRLWQWRMAHTVLRGAFVTGEQRQFIPFSPSAVNNNLKRSSGLITQSLPGWGQETAVSMYADGGPSLVLVKQAE